MKKTLLDVYFTWRRRDENERREYRNRENLQAKGRVIPEASKYFH